MRTLSRSVFISVGVSILTIAIGVFVLVGWHFDLESFKTILPGTLSMKANTAFCFILSGISLLLISTNLRIRKPVVILFSAIVFLVGALSFIYSVFGLNLGIENILYTEKPGAVATLHPGLMALSTSVNFMLLSFAFLLLISKQHKNSLTINFCVSFAATLSLFTMLGYITGFEDLAGPGSFSRMALHTAFSFLLLCFGILNIPNSRNSIYSRLEIILFSGITVSVAIILFVSLLSLDGMKIFEKNNKADYAQYKIIDRFGAIATKSRRMLTNLQNFAETGKETEVELYKNTLKGLPGDLDTLTYYGADKKVISQVAAIVSGLHLENQNLNAAQAKKLSLASLKNLIKSKSTQIDTMRILVMQERDANVRSAQQRIKKQALTFIHVREIVVFSLLSQIILVLFLFYFFKKDLKRRKESEQFTLAMNKELESKVEEQVHEIKKSEQKYHDMLLHSPIYITNTDISGNVLFVNPAFANIMEYNSIEDAYKDNSSRFYRNPDIRKEFLRLLTTDGILERYEIEIISTKGKIRSILANAWLSDGIIHTMAIDITERKADEENVRNLNRIYRILSSVNETIIHTKSRQELFDSACTIATQKGGFILAWIGILDETSNKVLPVASSGTIDDYLKQINVDLNDPLRRKGNIAQTVLTGTRHIALDIANQSFPPHRRENALLHGYNSLGSFPITSSGKTIGAFTLYSEIPNFFSEMEITLLDEVASDISFALEVFDKEAERKKYFDELQESEKRFRSTLDGIIEGFQIIGFDWRYLFLNTTAEQQSRHPKGELVGKLFTEVWPDITDTPLYKTMKQCFEHRDSQYMINEFKFPDGEPAWFELKIEPVPEGILILSSDVTEKVKTEQNFLENQRFLSSLIENSGAQIYAKDLQGRYIVVNKIWEQFNGFSRDEILGKTDDELFSSHTAEIFRQNDKKVIESDMLLEAEETMEVDGKVLHFLSIKFPLYDNSNAISGICGVSTEITARRAAERALQQKESHFRAIMETASDAIITIDKHNNVYDWNSGAQKIYGYTGSEIIGKPVHCLAPDEPGVQEIMSSFPTFISPDVAPYGKSYEGRGLHKDGHIFPIELSLARWETKDEHYITAIVRDITERKKVEADLIAAKEKAEEMNRVKSSFLANMSHELRTPLIGILGYSEILQSESHEEESINMARIIQESGDRLKTTLNMILDFSKIEAAGLKINPAPMNLIPLLRGSISLFEKAALLKTLSIDLNAAQDTLVAEIEERLFEDLLNNLIKNAIVYTDKGGITIKAAQQTVDGKLYIRIDVSDTGIGIAEKDFELIFEEFRQVSEGMNRGFEGTGLGLTLAKKYAEMMGGKITVASEIGKGSTFTVWLPAYGSETQKTAKLDTRTAAHPHPQTEKRTCLTLYVEDDDISRNLVIKILSNICNIDCASTGRDALEKAINGNYELFLIDINLGKGMDGIEVTKKLRTMPAYKNTPIVAVTAYAMPGDKEEFLAAGCNAYISKPFAQAELIEVVQRVLKL